MRSTRVGWGRLVGALVALWMSFCGVNEAAVTASATYIDEVQPAGQQDPPLVVFRSAESEPWQAAVAGMDLAAGDSVWVKTGASAVVKVGGTAVMHLEPDTVFTIPADGNDGASAVRRVHLDQGSAWTTVEKLLGGDTFTVTTKDAVGGVKGTQFRTSIDPDSGETDWDMEEGKLELASRAGGSAVLLEDGHNFRFLRGGRPAFDRPRPARERLKGFKSRFRQRFGTELPTKAAVRQMLKQRSRRVSRPMRRGDAGNLRKLIDSPGNTPRLGNARSAVGAARSAVDTARPALGNARSNLGDQRPAFANPPASWGHPRPRGSKLLQQGLPDRRLPARRAVPGRGRRGG